MQPGHARIANGSRRCVRRVAVGQMSVYGVHKLLKRIQRDPEFRDRLQREADVALAEYPLTDQERSALLAGEIE
jgi:hypothetical protein